MNQLEIIKAKHKATHAEINRLARSGGFVNSARLAAEYAHLISFDYGMDMDCFESTISKLEKFLKNPESQLQEFNYFISSILLSALKEPTAYARERIEYQIKLAKNEMLRADKAFFGSAQKSANALRILNLQEKRMARFVELQRQVPACKTVLESFVEQCNMLRTTEKTLLSKMSSYQKKIDFDRLHGVAYAKASALDAKSRQQASTSKSSLAITDKCPYCNGPMGSNPNADHIYPVKRGGLSTTENMVYCCQSCNSRKGDKGLVEFLMEEDLNIDAAYETLRSMGKRI